MKRRVHPASRRFCDNARKFPQELHGRSIQITGLAGIAGQHWQKERYSCPTTLSLIPDAYGALTPINQVGTVNVPEPRMVTINVWDKGLVGKVEKAIRESGLGINPQLNGTIIMLPIPELNEERRRELTKVAANYAEHARIAIRNVRRDGMDQIKKAKADGMSEDDQKIWEGEVQELTDTHIGKVDDFLNTKQEEIMQV